MITWMAALLLAAGTAILIRVLGLADKSRDVFRLSRLSLATMRNTGMSDAEKEEALQRQAGPLAWLFVRIAIGCATAVLLPFCVVWGFARAGLVPLEPVLALVFSPGFLVLGVVLAAAALWPASRSREMAGASDGYSRLDRILHRLAFRTYAMHIPLGVVETRMLARALPQGPLDRPVFITALPRAGTTLLLECCARLPDFASHCYRDMPFVMTPCLWSRFSASFKREEGTSRMRAHGDGMLINLDSPEALEEVLWAAFWDPHYRRDRIVPWEAGEEQSEFTDFYRDHMRKIILLRRGNESPAARYISKNNAGIARIGLLRRLFPDSIMVVPFREPVHHAASLLEQHLRFLGVHGQDAFSSDYMRAIGHFEFGANLRPIDFGGWLDRRMSPDTRSLAFWIEYWIASYGHLLDSAPAGLRFIGYEQFCEDPGEGLRVLGDVIGTRHPDLLMAAKSGIRPVRTRHVDVDGVPPLLLERARKLYGRLKVAPSG